MNKLFLVISFLILICDKVNAQISAGNDNVTSDGQITWTVGELVAEDLSDSQGSLSAVVTIQATGEVTMTKAENAEQIGIRPNPVLGHLTIDITDEITSYLYNADGKLLLSSADKHIDMTGYPSGTYILKIVDSNSKNIGSYKIVKQ